MLRQGIVKCSSLFFIVFLMCPKRVRPQAATQHEYYHAVKAPNEVTNASLRAGAEWHGVFRPDEDEYVLSVDSEHGFDLSDDEIRKFKLWPKGIIPYYIDVVSFDKVLRDQIRLFLNTVNSQTKLSFLELPLPPADEKTRWVIFVNRRGQLGCADHSIANFTNEGIQVVNLGYDCMATGGELAEAVLAIAGVPNQHNSPNRDFFITIVEENIMPGKKYLFKKLNDDEWLFHKTMYDLVSAGHFHHHRYSANGRATIEFRNKALHSSRKIKRMGHSRGFTKLDIEKIRMLYNYIVKKRENKVPECDQLFKKGNNFVALNLPEITPRKKPNKYLGVAAKDEPEDQYKQLYGSIVSVEAFAPVKESSEDDFKVAEYAGAKVDYAADYDGITRKMDLKSHPFNMKHKAYKVDPLLYLSDYQTGDERRRKAKEQKRTNVKIPTTPLIPSTSPSSL